jgi:hypothetical protein
MAHLSGPDAGGRRRGRPVGVGKSRGERAQLILIAGFVIAVTLVGLALIMNSAIYTENLASRSETSGAVDALSYRDATAGNLGEILDAETDQHPDDVPTARSDVQAAVEEYSGLSARQQVVGERVVAVSYLGDTEGTRVYQNGTGDFTPAGGPENWTVAADVTDSREFRINVSSSAGLSDRRNFVLNATTTDGSDHWYLNVSEDTSPTIRINASGAVGSCAVSGSYPFWINVTEGTVQGSTCGDLNFSSWMDGRTVDLRFENSSKIDGRFTVTVDERVFDDSRFGAPDADPTADHLLYTVRAELVYRTPQLNYETEIRVDPGESDD